MGRVRVADAALLKRSSMPSGRSIKALHQPILILEVIMGGLGSGRSGWKPKAEYLPQIDIRAIHRDTPLMEGSSIYLSHPATEAGVSISLAWTELNYGGKRPWFICPSCGSRAAILYAYSQQLLCRDCHDITYSSRCEGGLDTLLRREKRLLEKLGGHLCPKPKGMHMKTRTHLLAEYAKNSQKMNSLLTERIDNLGG